MKKYISCDCKCKLTVQHVIQIKHGIIKHVNVNVKIIVHAKKIIVGILAHVFVRIVSTLREIIFAGTDFHGFRGFLSNPRKLIPAKNLFCLKPRKLVPAKLVKNFDPQK